ncbi:hypothetical protein GLW07_12570 [Bacillus hwajinpoensis]|uniref:Uncharacterized protein n=1 Tax=Guptibacillus hwajinpoensis TaxID=208199 RepID=A0A845F0C8_9BACL|nr:hypothetical protein [Pseudalkalibacillus hwajinpoensis]MYL64186.1 hypothetical protein [Pseudalkalibacillus hwajinpoensis]
MKVLHDYHQMPSNYRNIYYEVRFESGKMMHKTISKIVISLKKKKNKTDNELKELELFKALLPFKYNDEDILSDYEIFQEYFPGTKRTTNVETRNKINKMIIDADFIHAHSKEFVAQMKEAIQCLGPEVLEEVKELALAEKKRIKNYQTNASKRKRIGKEINRELEEIAPKIIKEVREKKDFFTKLQFRKNRIGFFITPNVGKDHEILTEYLKKSKKSEQLFLENLDDENENYFITFSEPHDLAFMSGILTNRFMKEPLEGMKLLGIPLQVIIERCHYKGMEIIEPEWHELEFNEYYESLKRSIFAYNNRIKIKSYSDDSVRYVINQLMQITGFDSELYLSCYLHYNFLLPVQKYVNKRAEYFNKNDIGMSLDEFKEKRDKIYQGLLLKGKAKIKWKNELDLYKTVYKIYPDAIYQFRESWLDRQSLDVYIPSLKIGIEYQGQQHYEPVEFFGGQEGFVYRQKLDELKKEKCREKGIHLIQWSYKDIISKANLTRKINAINVFNMNNNLSKE